MIRGEEGCSIRVGIAADHAALRGGLRRVLGASTGFEAIVEASGCEKASGFTSPGLTPRELKIISRIASGYNNKDIAREFRLSESAFRRRLTTAFEKAGVSTRLELALFAVSHGLVGEA
ncbi:MAG: response regulator transcription factor [Terriglobia bacterium]